MIVYKYPLTHGVNNINLPSGSKPLKVGFQGKHIVLWALIPTSNASKDSFFIRIAFTGEEFNWNGPVTYISSDELDGIVIHAFELS